MCQLLWNVFIRWFRICKVLQSWKINSERTKKKTLKTFLFSFDGCCLLSNLRYEIRKIAYKSFIDVCGEQQNFSLRGFRCCCGEILWETENLEWNFPTSIIDASCVGEVCSDMWCDVFRKCRKEIHLNQQIRDNFHCDSSQTRQSQFRTTFNLSLELYIDMNGRRGIMCRKNVRRQGWISTISLKTLHNFSIYRIFHFFSLFISRFYIYCFTRLAANLISSDFPLPSHSSVPSSSLSILQHRYFSRGEEKWIEFHATIFSRFLQNAATCTECLSAIK